MMDRIEFDDSNYASARVFYGHSAKEWVHAIVYIPKYASGSVSNYRNHARASKLSVKCPHGPGFYWHFFFLICPRDMVSVRVIVRVSCICCDRVLCSPTTNFIHPKIEKKRHHTSSPRFYLTAINCCFFCCCCLHVRTGFYRFCCRRTSHTQIAE